MENIIDADIAAAVPLISFGALLGRTTPIQLLFMALFEVALFAANEYVALNIFSVSTCHTYLHSIQYFFLKPCFLISLFSSFFFSFFVF